MYAWDFPTFWSDVLKIILKIISPPTPDVFVISSSPDRELFCHIPGNKSLYRLSKPQFSHLKNEDNSSIYLTVFEE